MRLLLLSDWNTQSGGSEVLMRALRDACRAAGDEVRLLTCGAGDAGAGVADVRAFGSDHVALQTWLQLANPFVMARLNRELREFQPEALVVANFAYHLSPVVFRPARTVPTVVLAFDYKPVCPLGTRLLPSRTLCEQSPGTVCWRRGCVSLPHHLRDRPRYALVRRGLARAGVVVAPSRWMQEELARHGVPSTVLRPLVAPPPPDYRRVPATVPTFVYSGRLSPEKGVDVLLAAFRRVLSDAPAARLRIIGDGPLRPTLQRMAAEEPLSAAVTFEGWQPFATVERALAEAWALVAPSVWAEPYGLVAAEAIQRGVPVVASRVGGFADTVDDGVSGFLVPNGDESALAEALGAIALGRAFARHHLDSDIVRRAIEAGSARRYVQALHGFVERAGRHPLPGAPARM